VPVESPRPILSTPALAHATGFPARSLPSSTGVHIVAITALLLLSLAPVTADAPHHLRELSRQVDLLPDPTSAPTLPALESSSASSSSPASAASRSAVGRNAPSSASSMPVIHQRRQHIISNTPDATNSVQTILQPDIQRPARLKATLPIPTMVRMAPPQHAPSITAPRLSAVVMPAAPPAPAPVPQPTLPKIQHSTLDTVPLTSATQLADSPKLAAFATTGRSFEAPKPPAPAAAPARPAAPTTASASTPPSPPSAAKPASGTDARNLLVVNAFEVESHISERDIPAAEIHGRFEVTDSPSLPEGPTNGGSSNTVGVAGSGVADSGNGAGKGHASSTTASGAGTGGAGGKGAGGTSKIASSGSGHGAGIGTGAGEGAGRGAGTGLGNGAGAGAGGNGASPFAGMTIAGGTGANSLRSAPASATVDPHDPRPGYGLTIVSSGSSGGATRDLGVFNDGPVYTVFIDVSRLGIRTRWSLQYSAAREIRIAHPGVALTPPVAEDERLPQLPSAAVAANVGRTVVVQGNLKPDGKLEALHVMESPDQRLNEGVIASLEHWYFEPAEMAGEKIAVKVLIGIPIGSAMADNGVSQQADQHTPAQHPTAQ
jgi:Gram-negative bacterial TonB protein C-terminal